MRLRGRVAIVTGAARGQGKAIAISLAKEGANVVGADILDEELNKVAKEMTTIGRENIILHVDVSKNEDIQSLVKATIEKFGKVDILVNNAGIVSLTPFEELSLEEWRRIMAVNLDSMFMLSQEVTKHMKKQLYGKIINSASIAGQEGGLFTSPAYAVSKAGVICLTKSMARALAKYNIMVNAISPGFIDTPMTNWWPDEIKKKNIEKIPLARAGTPQDVANVVIFLSSSESDYITGHVINIDGGMISIYL